MAVPVVRLTPSAAGQLAASLGPGDFVRLSIDEAFGHDLVVSPRNEGDLALEAEKVTLLVDVASAVRADGLTIDFVSGDATGFRFRNPNAPPSVEGISPKKLKALLDEGKVQLFDVRTDAERLIARIPAARPFDLEGLLTLDRSTPVAFMCHKGGRSESSASRAIKEGFRTVYNLVGGIDAWSLTVDRSLRRY
jgi:monothiol glutaredoxin